MIVAGDIISYNQMCMSEGFSLQRGMNFRVNNGPTIILMSQRANAPYKDKVEENGEVLIYEGHDVPRNIARDPKSVDQPRFTPSGNLTENGKFEEAVYNFKSGQSKAELDRERKVFKFKLHITDYALEEKERLDRITDLDHNRMIPTSVKLEVWKRDNGKCVECGSTDNLHFDHILPFSRGGTSLKAENIQLLCARHNLSKSNKIV